MTKKIKHIDELKPVTILESVNGYKLYSFEPLIGKLLTLAESLGLQEKQEQAYKSLVKQMLWNFWERPDYKYSYDRDGKMKM